MAHRDCERAARQLKKAIGKKVRITGTGPNADRVGTLVRVGSARVWGAVPAVTARDAVRCLDGRGSQVTPPRVMAREILRHFAADPIGTLARAEAMNLEQQPRDYWLQVRAEIEKKLTK